jgi:hypothetical protein
MTGILLFSVIGLWFAFVKWWLMPRLMDRVPSSVPEKVFYPVVFAILLAAPVADEIVGGFQFPALCRQGAVVKGDEQKAAGKRVMLLPVERTWLSAVAIPIQE